MTLDSEEQRNRLMALVKAAHVTGNVEQLDALKNTIVQTLQEVAKSQITPPQPGVTQPQVATQPNASGDATSSDF